MNIDEFEKYRVVIDRLGSKELRNQLKALLAMMIELKKTQVLVDGVNERIQQIPERARAGVSNGGDDPKALAQELGSLRSEAELYTVVIQERQQQIEAAWSNLKALYAEFAKEQLSLLEKDATRAFVDGLAQTVNRLEKNAEALRDLQGRAAFLVSPGLQAAEPGKLTALHVWTEALGSLLRVKLGGPEGQPIPATPDNVTRWRQYQILLQGYLNIMPGVNPLPKMTPVDHELVRFVIRAATYGYRGPIND